MTTYVKYFFKAGSCSTNLECRTIWPIREKHAHLTSKCFAVIPSIICEPVVRCMQTTANTEWFSPGPFSLQLHVIKVLTRYWLVEKQRSEREREEQSDTKHLHSNEMVILINSMFPIFHHGRCNERGFGSRPVNRASAGVGRYVGGTDVQHFSVPSIKTKQKVWRREPIRRVGETPPAPRDLDF